VASPPGGGRLSLTDARLRRTFLPDEERLGATRAVGVEETGIVVVGATLRISTAKARARRVGRPRGETDSAKQNHRHERHADEKNTIHGALLLPR
jgi:hypothetical protein